MRQGDKDEFTEPGPGAKNAAIQLADEPPAQDEGDRADRRHPRGPEPDEPGEALPPWPGRPLIAAAIRF